MNELLIDQEFRSLIPTLQPEEFAELERSLIAEGNRVPIDIWNGYIVDGHNRYDICEKHSVKLKEPNILPITDRDDVRVWIIRNQFGRRNLSDLQRSRLALRLEDIFRQKAKERQSKAGKEKLPQNSAEAAALRLEEHKENWGRC